MSAASVLAEHRRGWVHLRGGTTCSVLGTVNGVSLAILPNGVGSLTATMTFTAEEARALGEALIREAGQP